MHSQKRRMDRHISVHTQWPVAMIEVPEGMVRQSADTHKGLTVEAMVACVQRLLAKNSVSLRKAPVFTKYVDDHRWVPDNVYVPMCTLETNDGDSIELTDAFLAEDTRRNSGSMRAPPLRILAKIKISEDNNKNSLDAFGFIKQTDVESENELELFVFQNMLSRRKKRRIQSEIQPLLESAVPAELVAQMVDEIVTKCDSIKLSDETPILKAKDLDAYDVIHHITSSLIRSYLLRAWHTRSMLKSPQSANQ